MLLGPGVLNSYQEFFIIFQCPLDGEQFKRPLGIVFLLSIIREGYTARCQHVLQRSQRVRGEPQTSLCLLLLVELRGRLHLPLHALQELQQLFRMVARIFQTTFKTIKISQRNNPP